MSVNDIPKNGWNEWAKYVLKTLEELKQQHVDSEKKIDDNKDDYLKAVNRLYTSIKILESRMTTRAAFSGAFAAMIPVTIALVIWLITKSNVQP
jgi:nitrate/nitrite-specific signal transduction histidine kinase